MVLRANGCSSSSAPVSEWHRLLGTPACPLDARLVCRDGTVPWNGLLLALWSDLARNHLADCQDCEEPMVIMLPEAKVYHDRL